MTTSTAPAPTEHRLSTRDGTSIAWREMGSGRPVVLLHGLFSDGVMNWIKFGTARKLADAGFRVIMPDLRAHGLSERSHDPARYHTDMLVNDLEDLLAALGLGPGSFDLAGFSLGGRTAVKAVLSGVAPRRLALVGMGLDGLADWDRRSGFFLGALQRFDEVKRGDPEYMAVGFMKTMKVDRTAAALLLRALGDIDVAQLSRITMPTLVLSGRDDRDNGSPEKLAELLPDATLEWIPGTHMSSVTEPALGEALSRFFA